jgi:cell division protein FtsB
MTLRRVLWPLLASAVLVGLLVGGVFPTRTYLHQRDQIDAEERRVKVLTDQNQKLASQVDQLRTDAEIERLAREQYNLVRPGEEAYAILPGPADAEVGRVLPSLEAEIEAEPSRWERILDTISFWD